MKAYKFEIQLCFDVVVENDSNNPLNKAESRTQVIENLREYIDSVELGDCVVSDGIEIS